jgi:hypothetical protein
MMKKVYVLFFAILLITSCTRQSNVDEQIDKFNGYSKFLKCGEKTRDLKDKNNNKIGTVKTGIDNDANFYVKIECTAPGKQLAKTDIFAGNKKDIPINKPDDPKEDHFTNCTSHDNGKTDYTCKIPLTQLPHCDEPGFVYSTHCDIRDNDGHHDDAWGDCGKDFHDKGCGKYEDDYEEPSNTYTILYGTTYSLDSLRLYHLNMTTGAVTLILKEYVGNTAGTYDGAAFNVDSSMFFFVNYSTRQLWVNNLNDANPSFPAGTLNGTAASGTYYNGSYYYINADINTINKVTLNSSWLKVSETVLDTLPMNIVVNDIAISPAGDFIYLVGEVNGGSTELIKYAMAADVYYTIAVNINDGTQIAYGSDDILYAVAPIIEGGSASVAYTVNTNTGVLTEIEEGRIIIVPDAFSDISSGPIM